MKRALVPVFLVVAALGLAACGGSHPRLVRHAPPQPNKTELRRLARLALDAAKGAGDAHPADAVVVRTTRRIAEAVDAGSGVGYASSPAYFVVVHGQFKDCNVPVPSGASCPTGSIVTLTVDPRTNTSTDSGVESRMPDVNKIGVSEPLPLIAGSPHSAPLVHRELGLRLTAVPAGYRPAVPARTVLDRFPGRRTNAPENSSFRLWTVNGAYPAWVFLSQGPKGTSVSVYDLRGRRWTMSYLVPRRGASPCRGGLCGFPFNQGGLDVAAGDAERFPGTANYFAGDHVDDVADRVVIHLVHAPRSVIDALKARHPGTYVIRNDASRTLAAVMAVEHGLDFTALRVQGIHIVSAGATEDGHLVVGVTKEIAKAQAYFDATYGRGFIRVVHGEPAIAFCACGPTGPKR